MYSGAPPVCAHSGIKWTNTHLGINPIGKLYKTETLATKVR
jgi:hypothetical protein